MKNNITLTVDELVDFLIDAYENGMSDAVHLFVDDDSMSEENLKAHTTIVRGMFIEKMRGALRSDAEERDLRDDRYTN